MDRYSYTAESLARAIREFEGEYCISSEDLHARYTAGQPVDGVPRFQQHVWASFYENVMRLTDGMGVERTEIVTRVGNALTCV